MRHIVIYCTALGLESIYIGVDLPKFGYTEL